MTREEELKYLTKDREPKEVTYAKWGWSPEQIAYYEKHGDWHEADARETRHICTVNLPLWDRLKLLFGAGLRVSLRFKTEPPRYLCSPNVELQVTVVR